MYELFDEGSESVWRIRYTKRKWSRMRIRRGCEIRLDLCPLRDIRHLTSDLPAVIKESIIVDRGSVDAEKRLFNKDW